MISNPKNQNMLSNLIFFSFLILTASQIIDERMNNRTFIVSDSEGELMISLQGDSHHNASWVFLSRDQLDSHLLLMETDTNDIITYEKFVNKSNSAEGSHFKSVTFGITVESTSHSEPHAVNMLQVQTANTKKTFLQAKAAKDFEKTSKLEIQIFKFKYHDIKKSYPLNFELRDKVTHNVIKAFFIIIQKQDVEIPKALTV